ncbi:RNA polymerase sigma factor [Actinomadura chibensis]|uniref:Sigma-70 family RNA polymerase sigma factor n=1 Tax=Actinomadura chibensis TaxID=392828 RepID=A0A5D0NV42_9ACTN|nr:sigma-70 family RNA polymerase sigma factor [Actinomadura chibensis]TYB48058.1 sigma-70 family RNA polymerase sigma factor [Actinomadura chibensis]
MSPEEHAEPPPPEEFEARYGKLIDAQWPRLLALCLASGRSRAEAEDIVQEAFLRFHERHAHIDRPEPYLRVTVGRLLLRPVREYPRSDVDATTVTDRCDIDEFLGHDLIRTALEQLPSRQRRVFALALAGFTGGEIADLLCAEPATVRSNLRHAKATLRAWWAQHWGEPH